MARILVVDDEIEIRDILREILERAGHEVSEASDGGEALRLTEREPFDMVVTDIVIPTKNGLEVILKLRKDSPATPVVAMSGFFVNYPDHEIEYLSAAKAFGCRHVLKKPFSRREVLETVGAALGE